MTQRAIPRSSLPEKGITMKNTKLWQMVKAGLFPKPFTNGGRERVWLEADIDRWLLERADQGKGDAP
ncbi:prophage regulatory protein [Neorhizobium sp. R1-B]|uniref:helix-turn-helix transcriptional regulator n=1 Tax=Neorhizobium sp. R1-B TaxID=2485162 RepID=UPI000DD7824E|nr:AlpA family phage regulatory protein [Neorhizobium sp. R1-B]TDX88471.1 prophage regulatory protein [Neorhizobium sp. R1-B]